MSFANSSYTDILATTIENRSGKLADNVTKNNALLAILKDKGHVRTFSGGHKILEELMFATNPNAGWYSGYDTLSTSPADVLSAAEYTIKQYAVPIIISGLEKLQNSGKEGIIDLMEGRLKVGESTMLNGVAEGVFSDGTGSGGKILTGLDSAVAAAPTSGTYGGIDRATWTFWRNKIQDPAVTPTSATIQASMNTLWADCCRGKDKPDLIVFDSVLWGLYMASLQPLQRFTDPKMARLGFDSVKFMSADVVLDGGIGGYCPASTGFFLNTDYLFFRPHAARNMVPLDPSKRSPINQDADVQILAWAGNLTCSGSQFQGRFIGT